MILCYNSLEGLYAPIMSYIAMAAWELLSLWSKRYQCSVSVSYTQPPYTNIFQQDYQPVLSDRKGTWPHKSNHSWHDHWCMDCNQPGPCKDGLGCLCLPRLSLSCLSPNTIKQNASLVMPCPGSLPHKHDNICWSRYPKEFQYPEVTCMLTLRFLD